MQRNNKNNRYLKDDSNIILTPSTKMSDQLNQHEKLIKQIINLLRLSPDLYKEDKILETKNLIDRYIYTSNGTSQRILYSSFTSEIFSINKTDGDSIRIITLNLQKLMDYADSFSEDDPASEYVISKKNREFIIKLWDHLHLAVTQINTTNEILAVEIDKAKNSLIDQFKGIEREYITILGIFASIIISFVAGITFSTSILENMKNVSIFRLSFVILFLAFVLLNAVHMLIYYIFILNNPTHDKSSVPIGKTVIKKFNDILLVLLIILVVCRIFRLDNFYIPFENISSFIKCIPTNIRSIVILIIGAGAGIGAMKLYSHFTKKTVTGSDQS